MKWIVKRDFFRTPDLANVEILDSIEGAPKTVKYKDDKNPNHPLTGKKVSELNVNHIHKGAFIELGTSKTELELQQPDSRDPQKRLIAQLRYAGCIGDAADTQVVERVKKEVEEWAEAKKNDEERNATAAEQNRVLLAKAMTDPQ